MGEISFDLNDLPMDIIFEILGRLPVEDIIRCRCVCRRLCQASYQRSVWVSVYERSNLLLPEGPSSSQSSFQLECLLIRATKINWNWTSPRPPLFIQRRFPRELPTYNFSANIISGRFLQLAQEEGISWYDLDANDISTPILTYPRPTVLTGMAGYLNYQVNANGEGPDSVWVAFVCEVQTPRIVVLKVTFCAKSGHKVKLHAEIPAENVIKIYMDYDWLFPVREFVSPDESMDLFHIPSLSTIYVPMHEQVQNLSDINNINYVITPRFLFLTYSSRDETLVATYTLPTCMDPSSSRRLVKSHSGAYPHAISNIQVVETHLEQPLSNLPSIPEDLQISFLALVYVHRSPGSWTSKIGLNLFDVTIHPTGTLTCTTQCQRTLNVGIATTTLSFSARSGSCLAVTHSTPGPVVLAHYIRREDSGCVMSVKALKLPDGLQSRDMLTFDGFRGRLCLINGWTNIEVLDCA